MSIRRKIRTAGVALLALALGLPASAGEFDASLPVTSFAVPSAPTLNIPIARARMAPDLALAQYERNARWQAQQLGESDDTTTITADLPNAAKHGRYRLKRVFSAPKTLAFKTIDFAGDGFVKANVIARLLQSEADHVKNGQSTDTAITRANYKFSYKDTVVVDGRTAHLFNVKPREKRAGLFKGKVYIDVYSGNIVRAEGKLVKSPSLFIKNIEFQQDYAQVGDFNLISHIHSVADTRIIGKAVVDISHDDYQVKSLTEVLAAESHAPSITDGR